jgi:hypothetical protein
VGQLIIILLQLLCEFFVFLCGFFPLGAFVEMRPFLVFEDGLIGLFLQLHLLKQKVVFVHCAAVLGLQLIQFFSEAALSIAKRLLPSLQFSLQ